MVSCGPRLVAQSCLTLCNLLDCVAHQAPLSMGFPSQEYWSWFSFPSPAALADPGIKPASPVSPELQVDSLPMQSLGIPPEVNIPYSSPNTAAVGLTWPEAPLFLCSRCLYLQRGCQRKLLGSVCPLLPSSS